MEKTAQSSWMQVWRSKCQSSWEEQDFAEDVSGIHGGRIWPPRSYSCSFCTSEFRSAQALGGHMNVHRRDRARLKQALSTSNGESETFNQIISSSLSPYRVSADLLSTENFNDHSLVRENLNGDSLGFAVEKSIKEEDDSLYFGIGNGKKTIICCKRLKMADDMMIGRLKANSIDELDLELRLGDSPANCNYMK